MSDSPSPSWGPASYDDLDLDTVLSGEPAGLPEPLLPVAAALAALRAVPARAELEGEAAARAMFRAHAAAARADRAQATSPPAGLLDRVPTARAVDDRPRPRPHSHRQRRPAGRRRQAVALLGGGAAAAAVAWAAYAGVFSGPGGQHGIAPARHGATIAQAPSSSEAAPPILNGGGSKVPTPSPTLTGTGGQPGGSAGQEDSAPALCRELFNLLASSGTSSSTARDDYQRLAQMAGGQSVFNYCAGFGVGWGDPVYRYPPDHGGGPGGHGGYGSWGQGGFGGFGGFGGGH